MNLIKSKIVGSNFGRDRQTKEQETPAEIQAIRSALIEGEKSGFSEKSVDEIWGDARLQHRRMARLNQYVIL